MKVRYTKYFVNGNLEGLTFDTEIRVSGLQEANSWIVWAHNHADTPVESLDGSDYTVFAARIIEE